jgi:hypothetical protein
MPGQDALRTPPGRAAVRKITHSITRQKDEACRDLPPYFVHSKRHGGAWMSHDDPLSTRSADRGRRRAEKGKRL